MNAIRPEVGMRSGEQDLESPILAALETAAYEILDDDAVAELIAETNASGFVPDEYEVLSMGPLDFATVTAPFQAAIRFAGEPDSERMYHGHAISTRVNGTIRFDGDNWTVDDYEIESAQIDGMDEDYED